MVRRWHRRYVCWLRGRDERMNDAEKKDRCAAPKLTVPMILFFLPVLIAVILGLRDSGCGPLLIPIGHVNIKKRPHTLRPVYSCPLALKNQLVAALPACRPCYRQAWPRCSVGPASSGDR